MPKYTYKYITGEGRIIQGDGIFNSESDAQKEVLEKSKHILYIKEIKGFDLSSFGAILLPGKVNAAELLIFSQELVALLKAGVTFERSLDIILKRKKGTYFEKMLEDVRKKIVSGYSVSDAWKDYESKLPAVFIPSLKAGEKSGNMVEVLERFIKYITIIYQIRAKLKAAMIYPLILISFTVILVTTLLVYVIPQFGQIFHTMGRPLPLYTEFILSFSYFVLENLLFTILIIIAMVLTYIYISSSDTGRVQIDRIKLKAPLFRDFIVKSNTSQTLRTLGVMLSGGIPIVDSLSIAVMTISNKYIAKKTKDIIKDIQKGNPLSFALEKTGVFPDIALELITVGENSGKLKEMLFTLSDFYDDEIDRSIANILSVIEPLLIVFMGLIVAGILLTIYIPLFSIAAERGAI